MKIKLKDKYFHVYAKRKITFNFTNKKYSLDYIVREGELVQNLLCGEEAELSIHDAFRDDIIVHTSNDKRTTRFEEEYKAGFESYENINYLVKGNRNPKKIIFAFPGFYTFDLESKNKVVKLSKLNNDFFEENLLISFQDIYKVYGSFMLEDDENNSIKKKMITLICNIINQYNIKETNIIFFGVSKGGTSAIIYGSYFSESKIISVAPKMNISDSFSYNDNQKYVFYNSIFPQNESIDNYMNKIKVNNQNILFVEGTFDYTAHNFSFKNEWKYNPNFELVLIPIQDHRKVIETVLPFVLSKILESIERLEEDSTSIYPFFINKRYTGSSVDDIGFRTKFNTEFTGQCYVQIKDENTLIYLESKKEIFNFYDFVCKGSRNSTIENYFVFKELKEVKEIYLELYFKNQQGNYMFQKHKLFLEVNKLEVENIYSIKRLVVRNNTLYLEFDLQKKINEGIELLYKRLFVNSRIIINRNNQSNEYIVFRKKRENFVKTDGFLKLDFPFDDKCNIHFQDIESDKILYEQKFNFSEIKDYIE